MLDTEDLIIRTLYYADKPLILNRIAVKTGIQPQLAEYHLKHLVKDGVILCKIEGSKKYYLLQPPFYNREAIKACITMLMPFIKVFASDLVLQNGADGEKVLAKYLEFVFQKIFE